jgi:hypothetical protein
VQLGLILGFYCWGQYESFDGFHFPAYHGFTVCNVINSILGAGRVCIFEKTHFRNPPRNSQVKFYSTRIIQLSPNICKFQVRAVQICGYGWILPTLTGKCGLSCWVV